MILGNFAANFKSRIKSANLSSYTEAVLAAAFFAKKKVLSFLQHTMGLAVSAGDRIKGGNWQHARSRITSTDTLKDYLKRQVVAN